MKCRHGLEKEWCSICRKEEIEEEKKTEKQIEKEKKIEANRQKKIAGGVI